MIARSRVLYYAAPGAKRAGQGATAKANRGSHASTKDANQAFIEKQARLLLRPVVPPPKRSPDEQARLKELMIKYGKFKRKQFLELEMKRNRFRMAKLKALNALPNDRRTEALSEENPPPPLNRPLWTHTPPIKGFSLSNLTERAAKERKKQQKDSRDKSDL